MSTALAAQLAQIRSQNVNPLDLKAQRKAHSQSLLFDAGHAATQDFDTIYRYCLEGFEELCQLDARFLRFGDTIFSEQSRNQDRTQMTKGQNDDLDNVLEDFLCLIGARIPLKPALKAIEWTIRRFRVHEDSTTVLLFAFLPYYSSEVFINLLSILPPRLPQNLKFLSPYVKSSTPPPRQAVVYSASNSRSLLGALSAFTLEVCQKGYQYPALVSLWASIATEAVSAMADQLKSARQESQRENHENVLRFFLPILNDALAIKRCPELKIGSYMILTATASKLDLSDDVLHALMAAVVVDWDSVTHAGLICLAVLAEKSLATEIPSKTLKAVLALPALDDDMTVLQRQYNANKLVACIILGILDNAQRKHRITWLHHIRALLSASFLSKDSLTLVVQRMIDVAQKAQKRGDKSSALHDALTDCLLELADSNRIGTDVQAILEEISRSSDVSLPIRIRQIAQASNSIQARASGVSDSEESTQSSESIDFDALAGQIDDRLAYDFSFLSHEDSFIYDSLAQIFRSVHHSKLNTRRFSDLAVLRKQLAMTEPSYFSFFIRTWSTNQLATARAAALKVVCGYIKENHITADIQILLPYIVHALSDRDRRVRRAAASLVRSFSDTFSNLSKMNRIEENRKILGLDQIYGQNEKSSKGVWLSPGDANCLVNEILLPSLDECIFDEKQVSYLIKANLEGLHRRKTLDFKGIKQSSRSSIWSFLCSHVVNSPLYKFKTRLLGILNEIDKVGSTSRPKLLSPIILEVSTIDDATFVAQCERENIDPKEIAHQAVCIVTPDDRDGVHKLKDLLLKKEVPSMWDLSQAALGRLKSIWSRVKPDLQLSIAVTLFQQAFEEEGTISSKAVEALQILPLSTSILLALLKEADFPSLSSDSSHISKKPRRTYNGGANAIDRLGDAGYERATRKGSLALELIENARPAEHPSLLIPLFDVLAHLSSPENLPNDAIRYPQIMAIDCMLAIVSKTKSASNQAIDVLNIRADVLVDCMSGTTDPQVRNNALLLLAALADIAPEMILHNVMPIFTHMGSNLLQQEDDFSAYVIQQIMDSIVSRLANSLHQEPEGAFSSISEILLSFAAAFEDIPSQRHVSIYATLLDKVGALDYLFALLAILSDKFPLNRKVSQFSAQISSRYDALTQLSTVGKSLKAVLELWQSGRSKTLEVLLTDPRRDGREVALKLLPLVAGILKSDDLRYKFTKAIKRQSEEQSQIQSLCCEIFEDIHRLSFKGKGDTKIQDLNTEILDCLLTLIPTADTIIALNDLFGNADDGLRQQILRSFEQRLLPRQGLDNEASRRACLDFIPQLLKALQESGDVNVQKHAVQMIDRIVNKYGKTEVAEVVEAAKVIVNSVSRATATAKPTARALQAASLLCFATIIEACGDAVAPVVSDMFSAAMNGLDVSISEDTEDPNLHNAGFALLLSIIIFVPWVISGAQLDRILKISYESANAEMGSKCDQARISTLHVVPGKDNARECLSALERTWKSAMVEGPKAIREHFDFLRLAIDKHPKSKMSEITSLLASLFLKAFDLRHIQLSPRTDDSYTDDEIEQVEAAVNECAIAVIYKLNDALFRPIFVHFIEWASDKSRSRQTQILRLTTVFSFLLKFFTTLKSIVTGYTGLILDTAVAILQMDGDDRHNEAYMPLWRNVVLTLHATFEHDQDDFYSNPKHSTPVTTALLSQLSVRHQDPATLIPLLIPAISSLVLLASSSASSSDATQKQFTTQLTTLLRADPPAVRLAAVKVARAFTQRILGADLTTTSVNPALQHDRDHHMDVDDEDDDQQDDEQRQEAAAAAGGGGGEGEEWLARHVPEMLPAVAELLEDDDERVENETRAWVGMLEGVLGDLGLGG